MYVDWPTSEVLIDEGIQVPAIEGELVDCVGRVNAVVFWQIGSIGLKVSVVGPTMVIGSMAVVAHEFTSGVKM